MVEASTTYNDIRETPGVSKCVVVYNSDTGNGGGIFNIGARDKDGSAPAVRITTSVAQAEEAAWSVSAPGIEVT
jgi:hypothetical protein